ncbi:hypothetical protein BDA99DRAFT_512319 [Phascolomyces articulosus]|uniref:Uncharacterized protein n=1 Tax=Phascolomyces articulosus TaxID=60185 RepID=A0AAD5JY64_9FUNG|nr:hypothetical protein BDA99DRAFT_512319 [Phascolomyces articulosus]
MVILSPSSYIRDITFILLLSIFAFVTSSTSHEDGRSIMNQNQQTSKSGYSSLFTKKRDVLKLPICDGDSSFGCPGYKESCIQHCQQDHQLEHGYCVPIIAGYKCCCY